MNTQHAISTLLEELDATLWLVAKKTHLQKNKQLQADRMSSLIAGVLYLKEMASLTGKDSSK